MNVRLAFLLLAMGLLLSASSPAASPPHVWSHGYGGGTDGGQAVAVDGSGNVFVTGHFQWTVDLGGGPLVTNGITDLFVVKYDANGVHQWSKSFGSTLVDDVGMAIAVDGSGDVFVTGIIHGTVDFGGGPVGGYGNPDVFIVKFDGSGTHQWSKGFGSSSYDGGRSIGVDSNGNVLVTGVFVGTVDFGGGALTSAGSDDIFLVKYDGSGAYQWSKALGGTANDEAYTLTMDGSDNVIVAGGYSGTVDFGGDPLVSAGFEDIFLAKYNSSGTHQWSRRFGGAEQELCFAVATDAQENVFMTGSFQSTVDFGGGPLVPVYQDIVVAKYSESGIHQWSKGFGSVSPSFGQGIAVDAVGNVRVTGYFANTVDFGGGPVTSTGYHDIFIAGFNANGVHQWSQGFGNTSNGIDRGHGIAVDASDDILVTGTYTGAVDFGGGPMIPAGDREIFVLKLCGTCADPCAPTTTLVINTGWDQVQGSPLLVGDVDNEWVAVSDPPVFTTTTEPRPAFTISSNAAWSAPQSNSAWISSFPTANDDTNGHYVFEYRFCLESNIGAGLNVSLRADDQASVYLNGHFMGSTGAHSFDQPPLVVTTSFFDWGKFNSGENVLRVDVENVYKVAMGFNLVGTITGQVPQYRYCCTDSASGVLGTVWQDPNQNGVKNTNEKGRAGWTVNLLQGSTLVRTTKSDGLGNYYFLDLVPGTYTVEVVSKGFVVPTTPVEYTVVLGRGEIVPNQNFGSRKGTIFDPPIFFDQQPIGIEPNPFNPEATISFSLSARSHVSMKIYDVTGRAIRTLANEELGAGDYRREWDGRNDAGQAVSSGVYFLRLVTNISSQTKKLMLLK